MEETKIMIVEDEIIIARDLEMNLKNMGYTISSIVHSGEDAITTAKTAKPDLVLMDIVLLGEIDGTEAADAIMSDCNIPVVYLTAQPDKAILEKAALTAPYGYITKPFEDIELRVAIEIAIHRHRADIEREKLISKLQEAQSKIRQLQGLLPICSCCKQIRDPKGYWHQLESYITNHSDVEFSHSLCPKCYKVQKNEMEMMRKERSRSTR